MNILTYRLRVSLAIFFVAIACELAGLAPGLEYISGAFPTHFHAAESAILTFGLFICLVIASCFYGRSRYVALVIIGALMFYSGLKAIMTITGVEPLYVRLIWGGVSFFMSSILAWIVIGAFKQGIFDLRGLIASFVIANIGFIYLFKINDLL